MYSLSAGAYIVSEDTNTSYTRSFSGDCDANGNITLESGTEKTCTITNNDIRKSSSYQTNPIVNQPTIVTPTPVVVPIVATVLPIPTPTPKLPSTGFAPQKNNTTNSMIAFEGFALLVISLYALRRKKII